jgi:hypothetical protein
LDFWERIFQRNGVSLILICPMVTGQGGVHFGFRVSDYGNFRVFGWFTTWLRLTPPNPLNPLINPFWIPLNHFLHILLI